VLRLEFAVKLARHILIDRHMFAVLDVDYDEIASTANAAAVVFAQWQDAAPISEYTVRCSEIQPYVPGEFFKRELPCLLTILDQVQEPLRLIVIDGYVSLAGKPGLGLHLWDALGGKVPIVGVAKTQFHCADAVEVFRGESKNPLYVTAAGINAAEAARHIKLMSGEFRIPALLRRVDQLARSK
jgi:deoxyribonuclease V